MSASSSVGAPDTTSENVAGEYFDALNHCISAHNAGNGSYYALDSEPAYATADVLPKLVAILHSAPYRAIDPSIHLWLQTGGRLLYYPPGNQAPVAAGYLFVFWKAGQPASAMAAISAAHAVPAPYAITEHGQVLVAAKPDAPGLRGALAACYNTPAADGVAGGEGTAA